VLDARVTAPGAQRVPQRAGTPRSSVQSLPVLGHPIGAGESGLRSRCFTSPVLSPSPWVDSLPQLPCFGLGSGSVGVGPVMGGVQTLTPGFIVFPPRMMGPMMAQIVPTVGGVKLTKEV
jgi:hypothetical protein